MSSGSPPRPAVLLVRGHQANPWELGPWQEAALGDRYEVSYLRTRRGWFATDRLDLPARPVTAMRDLLPAGKLGDLAVRAPGDRYLRPRRAFAGADIVHAQELGYWYSAQAARAKAELGFRLVLTVWETIPFLDAYRNVRTRRYRRDVLAATDLFVAMTERAGAALALEGVPAERIRISAPGIATERFAAPTRSAGEPLIVSPGRLVWEKGHQDVLRAVALLARPDLRVLIVGRGPEEARLRRYAAELGVGDRVEIVAGVEYDRMPELFARASCMVLASLPTTYWEEQFGMVLAEAAAAGLPILASSSGAIPEVVGGGAPLFAPGDWVGLAGLLETELASRPTGRTPDYSLEAAARRLVAIYDEVLA